MHRVRTLLISTLAALLLPSAGAASEYTLGLILGEQKDRRVDGEALNAAIEAFVASRRFEMAERAKLDAVFAEKGLQGFIGEQAGDLSEVLGLDMIGLVSYTSQREVDSQNRPITTYWIEVRLTDIRTGQILTTLSSHREDILTRPTTLRAAGLLLFESVREAFPPVGYVLRISGKEVIVDLGASVGVQDGDVLEVFKEAEPIIHPVTGKLLPGEDIVLATLKVRSASAAMSTCKSTSGDGAFGVGDQVRFRGRDTTMRRLLGKMNIMPRLRDKAKGAVDNRLDR